MNVVNFDNAATTFPKPEYVNRAVVYALRNYGGNAGRGGHRLSSAVSEMVYNTRETIADFFDAKPENVIFCCSCTHALNTAIKGVLKPGAHVIISSLEHNSVIRPLYALKEKGIISLTIVKVQENDEQTVAAFSEAINDKTQTVICTIASNVTGQIIPIKKISALCKKKNICLIADGAQACGIIPVSLKNDDINILCTSGHKGLYGISGTGILITDGKFKINPIIEGGTGSSSLDFNQPDFLPDALESGTLNTVGIASIGAGIEYLKNISLKKIFNHEQRMSELFKMYLESDSRIKFYRSENANYIPLISFNIKEIPSEKFAEELDKKGFCLRAGFHCSALAHRTLGTETGTIRFSPSVFNRESDVKKLCQIIKNTI